jgi:hypothetical protein
MVLDQKKVDLPFSALSDDVTFWKNRAGKWFQKSA